jgi:hypothetical protein
MSNYVGRRERFIGNFGQQNEAKNVTEGVNALKMFFTQEVRNRNNHLQDKYLCRTMYKVQGKCVTQWLLVASLHNNFS